jgi:hypothetical protein
VSLERELRDAGIPRGRRARILAELDDHRHCDPDADLGDPHALARQFADELGTAYARRAGFAVFLALVPVGLLFGALFAFSASAANVGTVLGTQLAFVGGTLALLRAWRLRRMLVIPAAESRVILRRASLAVAGGALTLASLGIATHTVLAWTTIGIGCVTLAAATASLLAARLGPTAPGAAGNLSDDLGLALTPTQLALWIAGLVALCIAAAGVVQSDPIDGLVRAVGDGGLCFAAYLAVGRPLGLRA